MFFSRKKKSITVRLEEITGDQSSRKIQHLIDTAGNLISRLHKECNAKFNVVNDNLIININNVKIYIECEEDLFILNEVFNEHSYGFVNNQNYVLIDIGLNIGISALYFSQNLHIKRIYAFEPVVETYQKCQRNIELNPTVTNIKTYNVGLGNSDRDDQFTFTEDFKGSVGSIELSDYKKGKSTDLKLADVKIENASTRFSDIIKANPDEKILVKMDCEGGEYEIIPNLKESGILDKVSIFMLEWHNDEFLKLLHHFDNFNCFYYKNSPTTGMLYATNRNIQ